MFYMYRDDHHNRHIVVYYITLLLYCLPDTKPMFLSAGLPPALQEIVQPLLLPRSVDDEALWVAAKRASTLLSSARYHELESTLHGKFKQLFSISHNDWSVGGDSGTLTADMNSLL